MKMLGKLEESASAVMSDHVEQKTKGIFGPVSKMLTFFNTQFFDLLNL